MCAENREQCRDNKKSCRGPFGPIPEREPHLHVFGNIHRAFGGVILNCVMRIRGHFVFPILLQPTLSEL